MGQRRASVLMGMTVHAMYMDARCVCVYVGVCELLSLQAFPTGGWHRLQQTPAQRAWAVSQGEL